MNCLNCQNPIVEGEKFCGKCGRGDVPNKSINKVMQWVMGSFFLLFGLVGILGVILDLVYFVYSKINLWDYSFISIGMFAPVFAAIALFGKFLLSQKSDLIYERKLLGFLGISLTGMGVSLATAVCIVGSIQKINTIVLSVLVLLILGFIMVGASYLRVASRIGYFRSISVKGITMALLDLSKNKSIWRYVRDILINIFGFAFVFYVIFVIPFLMHSVSGGVYFFMQFNGVLNVALYFIWIAFWKENNNLTIK